MHPQHRRQSSVERGVEVDEIVVTETNWAAGVADLQKLREQRAPGGAGLHLVPVLVEVVGKGEQIVGVRLGTVIAVQTVPTVPSPWPKSARPWFLKFHQAR